MARARATAGDEAGVKASRMDESGRPKFAGAAADLTEDDAWECRRCGQAYPDNYVNLWGSEGRGDGYGPEACCTALVEDVNSRPAADGSRGRRACRGPLVPVTQ